NSGLLCKRVKSFVRRLNFCRTCCEIRPVCWLTLCRGPPPEWTQWKTDCWPSAFPSVAANRVLCDGCWFDSNGFWPRNRLHSFAFLIGLLIGSHKNSFETSNKPQRSSPPPSATQRPWLSGSNSFRKNWPPLSTNRLIARCLC